MDDILKLNANTLVELENNKYEWNFDNNYKPSKESIRFWLWEKEFFKQDEFKTPPFHYFITDNLYRKGYDTKTIECYRGAAKSTLINVKSFLYWVFYGEIPNYGIIHYGYIASASIDLIKGHIEQIHETIINNPKLSKVFEIKKINLGDYPRLDIFNKILGRKIILEGKSPTQKIRGKKAGEGHRADFLICDDVESEESVKTTEAIAGMAVWLTEAILPSLKKGGLTILIGTPLHEDSLLSRNANSVDTTSIVVKACKRFNPLREPLLEECAWQDSYPPELIMKDYKKFKRNKNTLGFWQEIMLQLKADDAQLFDTTKLGWFSMVDQPIDLQVFVSLDAGSGSNVGLDDSAFSVIGVRPDGYWYILEIFNDKLDTIEIVNKIFSLCNKYSGDLVMESGIIANLLEPLIDNKKIEDDDDFSFDFETFIIKKNTVLATGRSGKGNGKLNVFKMHEPRVSAGKLLLPIERKLDDGFGTLVTQMEGISHSRILVPNDDVLDSVAQLELLRIASVPEMSEEEYRLRSASVSYSYSNPYSIKG